MRFPSICLLVLLGLPSISLTASPSARAQGEVTQLPEASATPPPAGVWRRTSQGWQRTSSWPVSSGPPPAARVHPLLVASLIALVSLGGLIGFAGQTDRR